MVVYTIILSFVIWLMKSWWYPIPVFYLLVVCIMRGSYLRMKRKKPNKGECEVIVWALILSWFVSVPYLAWLVYDDNHQGEDTNG